MKRRDKGKAEAQAQSFISNGRYDTVKYARKKRWPFMTLREPIFLREEEDGHLHWVEPSNLHDKIIYFMWRRGFDEAVAKIRHSYEVRS